MNPHCLDCHKEIAARVEQDLGLHGQERMQDCARCQPAPDLRLDGNNLGGTAWGFSVDARARRTYRKLSGGGNDKESRSRLYRLAATRRGIQDRWDLTIGRQFSPELAGVSIFDGVSAGYRGRRWTAGLISGTQPDPEHYDYSSEVREHGLYFQYHSCSRTSRPTSPASSSQGSWGEWG